MRILIVEDDNEMRDALSMAMRQCGHQADVASDAERACGFLASQNYDLAMVDAGLPGMDGITLVRRIRKHTTAMPIIIVTARDSLNDRVIGLDSGADDYIVKPFELAELEARVRALLRRANGDTQTVIKIGALTFTPGQPRVQIGGNHVDLPHSEFVLLELLVQRPGKVVRREEIAAQLTRDDEPPSDAAIDISMHRLRRRLAACGLMVRTLRGFGYVLERPVDET